MQKSFCVCPIRDLEPWMVNQFRVPNNTYCPLCNELVPEKHFHCGYCTNLTWIE